MEMPLAALPVKILDDQLVLEFLTMTRLKYAHTLTREIPFHVLIRNLLRRISTLYYFYHGQKADDVDYKAIIAEAEKVVTFHDRYQRI